MRHRAKERQAQAKAKAEAAKNAEHEDSVLGARAIHDSPLEEDTAVTATTATATATEKTASTAAAAAAAAAGEAAGATIEAAGATTEAATSLDGSNEAKSTGKQRGGDEEAPLVLAVILPSTRAMQPRHLSMVQLKRCEAYDRSRPADPRRCWSVYSCFCIAFVLSQL